MEIYVFNLIHYTAISYAILSDLRINPTHLLPHQDQQLSKSKAGHRQIMTHYFYP